MVCSVRSVPYIFSDVKKYATSREVTFGFRAMNLWVKDAADPSGRPNTLVRAMIRIGLISPSRIGAGRGIRCNHWRPCRRSCYHATPPVRAHWTSIGIS